MGTYHVQMYIVYQNFTNGVLPCWYIARESRQNLHYFLRVIDFFMKHLEEKFKEPQTLILLILLFQITVNISNQLMAV